MAVHRLTVLSRMSSACSYDDAFERLLCIECNQAVTRQPGGDDMEM